MNAIYLVQFGTIDEEIISPLEVCLWQVFGFDVKRLNPLPDPAFALDQKSGQWNSSLILKDLVRRVPDDAIRLLGITERDLFIPMLSFVFGHAQLNGPAAVISLARLRQEFYRLPPNAPVFHHRIMKEAVHELGHTFGLVHCHDPLCAMSLSNIIQHVDKKNGELCSNCSILFEEFTNHRRRNNGMEMQR
ncbi:MAG: archaemetzincin family Zn-dependent metalloprotease [Bacteriovoracaceae bacterium]|nr:archaemetzincin family Zn-dependent metalloprotease [Bacteroidota bacterium]